MRYIVPSYENCTRCPLHQYRRHVVFGRGQIPAKVLFVGEAPGKSEDTLGLPFVGPIGRLLGEAIKVACRFARLDSPPRYFISNIVGCRPTDEPEGENRQPTPDEAWCCWQRLVETYADVNPQRVVLLGQVAKVFGKKAWPEAICLPHPAYIVRQGGTQSPAFTALARDLSAVFKEVSNA
jgi:uracil-DNA glycosylase